MDFRDVIHLSRRESGLQCFLETPPDRRPRVFKTQIERHSPDGLPPVQVLIDTCATKSSTTREYLNMRLILPVRHHSTHSLTRMRVRLIIRVEGDVANKHPHKRIQNDRYFEGCYSRKG